MKTVGFGQLIHLLLTAATHHPRLTVSVAGQGPADEFQLRMPGLARVDKQASGRQRRGNTRQGAGHHLIVTKQLVEAGDNRQGWLGLDRRQRIKVEGIALFKAYYVTEPSSSMRRGRRGY